MKHNHDKRSTCCLPPKMFCPETMLKNLDLDIGKNYKKLKQIIFLLLAFAFYESNLQ